METTSPVWIGVLYWSTSGLKPPPKGVTMPYASISANRWFPSCVSTNVTCPIMDTKLPPASGGGGLPNHGLPPDLSAADKRQAQQKAHDIDA
jgi:hypothetical protein